MLRKLSSGQGRPTKKRIFGHVISLTGENIIVAYSEKFHRATAYTFLIAAKLLLKENADSVDPVESLPHIQTSVPRGTLNKFISQTINV